MVPRSTSVVAHHDASISISVPSSHELGQAPLETLVSLVENFAVDVLEEASKEELAHRADSSQVPQYTTRHLAKAASIVRDRGFTSRQKPRWYLPTEIAQPILFLAAGACFGLTSVGWGWLIPAFISTFLAALGLTMVKINDSFERR